ncbi:MAG TPA: hypothetical protein VLC28_08000 [Flavitalea sp.]|nr:hypothetical protein [Flavitalea sp.]
MKTSVQYFTSLLFDRNSIEEVEPYQVDEIIEKFPYFIPVRLIRDRVQLRENNLEDGNSALYFNNYLWYEHLLTEKELEDESENSTLPANVESSTEVPKSLNNLPAEGGHITVSATAPSDGIAFEPYHTIDYFASQGIKLAPADLSKDKFGQQLKSFTEWLKSMKRLPAADVAPAPDLNAQQTVVKAAEHSIEEREVLTEAMAEVWAKQGNKEKAREVYQKLSLQNPSKSSYFAAKIDEINSI